MTSWKVVWRSSEDKVERWSAHYFEELSHLQSRLEDRGVHTQPQPVFRLDSAEWAGEKGDLPQSLGSLYEWHLPADAAIEVREALEQLRLASGENVQIQSCPIVGWPDEVHEVCRGFDAQLTSSAREPMLAIFEGIDSPQEVKPAPDFRGLQGYLEGSNLNAGGVLGGVNARAAWRILGGRGKGVTIGDVEKAWGGHEQLPKVRIRGNPSKAPRDLAHGVAVVGLMSAPWRGSGIRGLVDQVSCLEGLSVSDSCSVAMAVLEAALRFPRGSVLLLEADHRQNIKRPDGGHCITSRLPMELAIGVFEAIQFAVGRGIHVVQAAGNGDMDLDSFPGGSRELDSGSILVGAGSPQYGSRVIGTNSGGGVDLFSWGSSVVTLGSYVKDKELWSDLWPMGAGEVNNYTRSFNSTSSAAAIVGGAVASIAGILKAHGLTDRLGPRDLRALLVSTGYDKLNSVAAKIGRHPDLHAAIVEIESRFDLRLQLADPND